MELLPACHCRFRQLWSAGPVTNDIPGEPVGPTSSETPQSVSVSFSPLFLACLSAGESPRFQHFKKSLTSIKHSVFRRNPKSRMLPLSFYSTAQSALSGAVAASHARTSVQMGGAGAAGIKPWDVKQEGGQRDSGWGTGEKRSELHLAELHCAARSSIQV